MRRQDEDGESSPDREDVVEIPEGPEDLANGDEPLAMGEGRHPAGRHPAGRHPAGRHPAGRRVPLREGESAAEAFWRVQRERAGAGAVFVIGLETL